MIFAGGTVFADRVGSVRLRVYAANAPTVTWERHGYYPYGEEKTATAGNRAKFGTYTRDAATGLDYADQRYYGSGVGRFLTSDPYEARSGLPTEPSEPQSWNRFAYVEGDPVNYNDPQGLNLQFLDVADGGGGGGGGGEGLLTYFARLLRLISRPVAPIRQPPPKKEEEREKEDPECFAQLKYRDVEWAPDTVKQLGIQDILPINHAFWWVQDRTGTHHIISAGPANSNATGHLQAFVVVGDANKQDHAGQLTHWTSGLSASDCNPVERMLTASRGFPQHKFIYDAASGPNSNTAARYFGRAGGFNPSQPPLAWGWGAYLDFN